MTAPGYFTTTRATETAEALARTALDARVRLSLGSLPEARRLTRRVAHVAAVLDDLLSTLIEGQPETACPATDPEAS
jgi:hypothetical protein